MPRLPPKRFTPLELKPHSVRAAPASPLGPPVIRQRVRPGLCLLLLLLLLRSLSPLLHRPLPPPPPSVSFRRLIHHFSLILLLGRLSLNKPYRLASPPRPPSHPLSSSSFCRCRIVPCLRTTPQNSRSILHSKTPIKQNPGCDRSAGCCPQALQERAFGRAKLQEYLERRVGPQAPRPTPPHHTHFLQHKGVLLFDMEVSYFRTLVRSQWFVQTSNFRFKKISTPNKKTAPVLTTAAAAGFGKSEAALPTYSTACPSPPAAAPRAGLGPVSQHRAGAAAQGEPRNAHLEAPGSPLLRTQSRSPALLSMSGRFCLLGRFLPPVDRDIRGLRGAAAAGGRDAGATPAFPRPSAAFPLPFADLPLTVHCLFRGLPLPAFHRPSAAFRLSTASLWPSATCPLPFRGLPLPASGLPLPSLDPPLPLHRCR